MPKYLLALLSVSSFPLSVVLYSFVYYDKNTVIIDTRNSSANSHHQHLVLINSCHYFLQHHFRATIQKSIIILSSQRSIQILLFLVILSILINCSISCGLRPKKECFLPGKNGSVGRDFFFFSTQTTEMFILAVIMLYQHKFCAYKGNRKLKLLITCENVVPFAL